MITAYYPYIGRRVLVEGRIFDDEDQMDKAIVYDMGVSHTVPECMLEDFQEEDS